MTPEARNQSTPLAKCLAILGTGSDVGKSIVVTGLCRVFHRRGVRVAPYKAQNMSNNSHVTLDGGEMGRAQVVQAQAAGVEPTVDMNPVLLKPSADTTAQVIVRGKPIGNAEAFDYFRDTDVLFDNARESLRRLRERYDLIVMEGAGSCGEVNLRDRDFVNFRMAADADAPVVLVADIDRGGVFAQIVGTLDVIPPEDRGLVAGVIINRFRGDARLFDDGIDWLEKRTGLPILGLVPWFYHIDIDSEDGMPLDVVIDPPAGPVGGRINIAVLRWPHISNFTDFNPLQRESCVNLHYLAKPRALDGYDLLLLPGCKNVRADLQWLRDTGWENFIRRYLDDAGRVGGVCGGYQMLGEKILDPQGLEGPPGETPGLGLLNVETTLRDDKTLTRTKGTWLGLNQAVDGYEIHNGLSRTTGAEAPVLQIASRNGLPTNDTDGAQAADGRIWGTYLHGLFDDPAARHAFLRRLNPDLADQVDSQNAQSLADFRETQYNLLAEHMQKHIDVERLCEIVGL
ncbi:MAG: cobyric acid synthase [Phycisphaerae bacterium]|nr:cobyric acid synthase [Phycisphaerae bacterium]